MSLRDDGLTKEEGEVMDSLISAAQGFARLPVQHPDEARGFEYPVGWPIKGTE